MPFLKLGRIPTTGNEPIDAEHGDLVEAINDAYEIWRGDGDGDTVRRALNGFLDKVRDHFRKEEMVLRASEFPEWKAHAIAHAKILADLESLLLRVTSEAEPRLMSIEVFTLIEEMFYEHEILEDQDYRTFFTNTPRSDALLPWSDEFLIGHEGIDRQHKTLVALLNDLHERLRQGQHDAKIESLLNGVLDHVRWHFHYEETLMAALGTAGLDSHKILHEQLLEDLERVIQEYRSGAFARLEDLLENYLKYWLLDHIRHMDVRIKVSLNALDGALPDMTALLAESSLPSPSGTA